MKKFFYFIQDVSKTSRVFLALMKFLQQKNDTNSVAVKEKYFKKINQRNSISDATIGLETRNGRCCIRDQNFDYFWQQFDFFQLISDRIVNSSNWKIRSTVNRNRCKGRQGRDRRHRRRWEEANQVP